MDVLTKRLDNSSRKKMERRENYNPNNPLRKKVSEGESSVNTEDG